MKTYVLIKFPESQLLMGHPRFNECFPCISDNAPEHAYFVPRELYRDIKEDSFKDGDILSRSNNLGITIVIYKETNADGGIISYAGIGDNIVTCTTGLGWGYTEDYNYATKEEKEYLIKRLKEEGKYWDSINKKIENI